MSEPGCDSASRRLCAESESKESGELLGAEADPRPPRAPRSHASFLKDSGGSEPSAAEAM